MLREVSEPCTIWKQYEQGKSYQDTLNLSTTIPSNVLLYQGTQWDEPTHDNLSFPRPVYNIAKLIGDLQISILNVPVKFLYKSSFFPEQSKKFTRFNNYMLDHLHFESFKRKLLKQGYKKGTMITYIYWDDNQLGKRGKYKGDLKLELIDVLDIFFANPSEPNEQYQDWIIIRQRKPISVVKGYCEKKKDQDLVVPDRLESDYDLQEQDGSELCTMLTKLSRDENGEVVFERAVKGVVLHKPKRINVLKIKKELEQKDVTDKETGMSLKDDEFKACLYPLVVGQWEEREGSIYGISGIDEIKGNQKAINNLSAFSIYAAQQQVTSAIIAKDDALEGQEITNEPGQVITDYHKGGGQGLYKLPETQLSAHNTMLFDSILSSTRGISGISEVMTGDIGQAQASGYLVQLLQEQAKKPLEDKQKSIFEYIQRLGLVMAQFYKIYFEGEEFVYKVSEAEMIKSNSLQMVDKASHTFKDEFKGSEYLDVDFDVEVEVGATSRAGELGIVQQLQDFLKAGFITFADYIKLIPEAMLPNKSEFEEVIAMQQMSEVGQLKSEMVKYQQAMQVLAAQLKQKTDEQEMLKSEFTNKINQANDEIRKRDEFMKTVPIKSGNA